jgi:hypothetical protein
MLKEIDTGGDLNLPIPLASCTAVLCYTTCGSVSEDYCALHYPASHKSENGWGKEIKNNQSPLTTNQFQ